MSTSILHIPSRWIISKRDDLTFFIGSSILGYCLVALAFGISGLPAVVFFQVSFLIDGPHVYSTATRVLFDSEERHRQRFRFLALVPLCLAAPLLSFKLDAMSIFLLVMVWGQYHVAKQHMGLVFIYKRKCREESDFRLDRYFTLVSLMLPFAGYVSAFAGYTIMAWLLLPGIGFAAYYFVRQSRKEFLNVPKLLLLALVIPLHWLAWGFAALEPRSFNRLLAAAAITTIGHGLQYLRLMWLHNNNRYSHRSGVLGLISRNWLYFTVAAIVLSIPQYLGGMIGNETIASGAIGFLMLHYLLDSKIWRIHGNPELARALNLA